MPRASRRGMNQIALMKAVNAMYDGMRGVARVFGEDIARVIETMAAHLLTLSDQILIRMKGVFLNLAKIPFLRDFGTAMAAQTDQDRAALGAAFLGLGPALRKALEDFGASQGPLMNTDKLEATLAVVIGALGLKGKELEQAVAAVLPQAAKQDAKADAEKADALRREEGDLESAGVMGRAMAGANWAGSLASTVNYLFGRSPGDRIGERQIALLEQLVKNTSGPQVVTVEGVFD